MHHSSSESDPGQKFRRSDSVVAGPRPEPFSYKQGLADSATGTSSDATALVAREANLCRCDGITARGQAWMLLTTVQAWEGEPRGRHCAPLQRVNCQPLLRHLPPCWQHLLQWAGNRQTGARRCRQQPIQAAWGRTPRARTPSQALTFPQSPQTASPAHRCAGSCHCQF